MVWVKMPNFALYGRARGVDFQVGRLIRTRKGDQTRGSQGMLPRENQFKFKSSEMAINASKTANSDIDL